jgi:hypothetical protein
LPLEIHAVEFDTDESVMELGPAGHRFISSAPVIVVASMITTFPSAIKMPEMVVKADKRRTLRIIREKLERTALQKLYPCIPT